MGNQSTCQRFCQHKQQQRQHEITSQLRINQYPLQCQLCHKQIQHTNFKSHIDKEHFASIEEKDGHISVVCVLCDGVSSDLQGHKVHLGEKHPYIKVLSTTMGENRLNNVKSQQSISFDNNNPISPSSSPYMSPYYNKKNKLPIQPSNKLLKSKIKQIDSISRIKIFKQITPYQFLIQFQSQQYEMFKQSKQYNGMEYDQSVIFPQLVLFPVFSIYKQRARYYVLQKYPLQKTIQCNAYVICDRQ